MRNRQPAGRHGFTLIELAIVMLIIGLIVAFIASVSFAGIEQAKIRATQSLITKLEMGLNERLDALLQMQVTPNGAHQYLAAIPTGPEHPGRPLPWGLPSDERAQVIARIDLIKRELPDVFFIQSDPNYPVNFAGPAVSNGHGPLAPGPRLIRTPFHYVLPDRAPRSARPISRPSRRRRRGTDAATNLRAGAGNGHRSLTAKGSSAPPTPPAPP